MRKIVLDTETTGLDFTKGDRITEIGCVELIDNEPTGRVFQTYINPERLVTEESVNITGLTNDFLQDKPKFIEIADDFLKFIGNDPIIAHNANFDIGFLNFELEKCFYKKLKNLIIDTLEIAKKKIVGNHSLNALCKKYKISINHRNLHGALLDAKLLAKVYGFLCIEENSFDFKNFIDDVKIDIQFQRRMKVSLTENEEILHENFIKEIKGSIF